MSSLTMNVSHLLRIYVSSIHTNQDSFSFYIVMDDTFDYFPCISCSYSILVGGPIFLIRKNKAFDHLDEVEI